MLLELAVCISGIYVCFLTWGVTQERVTTTPYAGQKFKHYIFLNVIQALSASVVGYIYLRLRGRRLDKIKSSTLLKSYAWIALLNTMASPFGYASLKYIDYPTLILGKSCKLVPVMLMHFVIYRRSFPPYKYFVVGLITLGVSSFMLLHPQEGKKHGGGKNGGNGDGSSLFGLLLLSINLLMDGAINSTQDQVFHRYKVQGTSMMVFMNLFAAGIMALYLLLGPYLPAPITNNELHLALAFCSTHSRVIYDILLFGFCGAVGQCFIFHTLERFGSLSLVTVTVTRKMFSILLSAFWFDHKFSVGQWMAVATVFIGIGMDAYMKQKSKITKVVLEQKSTAADDVKKVKEVAVANGDAKKPTRTRKARKAE
ncbi:UDP-galactose transporter [Quaeritorhiza haematococci]|nr:UDP-galactose transporter [Quaeritorhiza haematococci]